jgi:hypothetical protein
MMRKRPRPAPQAPAPGHGHGLGALPSLDEQKQLQNVYLLMRSNLQQLQATELLDQVSATKKMAKKKFQDWLETLQEGLKTRGKGSLNDRELSLDWLSKQQYTGLSLHNLDQSIVYQSPETLEIVGSQAVDTGIAPFYTLDLAVLIPNALVGPKDVLNHVYFDKKRLFLAGLWKTLQLLNKKAGYEVYSDICIIFLKGDERRPVLQLRPAHCKEYAVRLVPALGLDVLKLVQLRSVKNNARPKHWVETLSSRTGSTNSASNGSELDPNSLPPTPDYNRCILEDLSVLVHGKVLDRLLGQESVREGLVLCKIWLRQCALSLHDRGLDNHLLALLVAFLVRSDKLNAGMPPLAVFTAVLHFLSETNFNTTVLDISSGATKTRKNVSNSNSSSYISSDALVLLHPLTSGTGNSIEYNPFWRLSSNSLQALQLEARQALALVQDANSANSTNTFSYLFLEKRSGPRVYDAVLHIPVHPWSALQHYYNITANTDVLHRLLSDDINSACLHMTPAQYLYNKVDTVLRVGLSDRVQNMRIFVEYSSTPASATGNEEDVDARDHNCPLGYDSNAGGVIGYVVVQMTLHAEHWQRKVDKGPPVSAPGEVANSANNISSYAGYYTVERLRSNVEVFQSFFGDIVQVRRFKTGDILHSVLWDTPSSNNANNGVLGVVLGHILSRHLPEIYGVTDNGNIHFLGPGQLDQSLARVTHNTCSSTSSTLSLMSAYDKVRAILLSSLSGIPLAVNMVSTTSTSLRGTSSSTPSPHPLLLLYGSSGNVLDPNSLSGSTVKAFLQEHMGKTLSLLAAPLELRMVFETSTHWPSDVEAVRNCKLALLLQLKKVLWEEKQVSDE